MTARVDCENVQQPTCTDVCPEGSQPGNNRGLDGTCCTGNGTCCSNNCDNGVCIIGSVPECVTPADCGTPPACAEYFCIEGTCEINGGCGAGELCCPAQGGSCAECCDDSDCPAGTPICYIPGDPTDAYCVECVDSGDCGACQECEGGSCVDLSNCCTGDDDCTEPCTSCVGGTCTPYAEYCPATDTCYNTGTGGCCPNTEDGCDRLLRVIYRETPARPSECCTSDDIGPATSATPMRTPRCGAARSCTGGSYRGLLRRRQRLVLPRSRRCARTGQLLLPRLTMPTASLLGDCVPARNAKVTCVSTHCCR